MDAQPEEMGETIPISSGSETISINTVGSTRDPTLKSQVPSSPNRTLTGCMRGYPSTCTEPLELTHEVVVNVVVNLNEAEQELTSTPNVVKAN